MPPVEALKGVSFELPSAGLVFILGKSGCGKTTLLNILGGLDDFDGGDVTVNGRSFKSFTQKDYDDYRNRKVGFVFQENNLFDEYTAEYNVGMALSLQSVNDGDKKTYAALKAVGLEDYGKVKPNRLSGGTKTARCHSACNSQKSAAAPLRRAYRRTRFRNGRYYI